MTKKKKVDKTETGTIFLPVENIVVDENQPRKFKEDSEFKQLVSSVEQNGLLSPICVRKINPADNQYMVVFGERRFRACMALGHAEIQCTTLSPDTPEIKIRAIQIAENADRADLSFFETANAVLAMKKDSKLKKSDIAKMLDKSNCWVSKIFAVEKLSAECIAYLQEFEKERGIQLNKDSIHKLSQFPKSEQLQVAKDTECSHSKIDKLLKKRKEEQVRSVQIKSIKTDDEPEKDIDTDNQPEDNKPQQAAVEDNDIEDGLFIADCEILVKDVKKAITRMSDDLLGSVIWELFQERSLYILLRKQLPETYGKLPKGVDFLGS